MAPALADTVVLSSGTYLEGIILRIEAGTVQIETTSGQQLVALEEVASIDFNTPHLTEGTPSQPLEHFTGTLEAQEMVRLAEQLEEARYQLHLLLGQIEGRWLNRPTVRPEEVSQWNADRERFQVPLAEYQETLREIYLHVLAHVDDYNLLATDAHELYVGVEGIFNVGSPLIPGDETQLPLRRFLPRHVGDQIYYEGFKDGASATRQVLELGIESPNRILTQPRDDQEN